MRFLKLYLLSVFALFLVACSDDDDDTDYLFDREITEYSVLKECSPGDPDGKACFKIRYRYPISTDKYSGLCVWLDTTVVDSTTLSVNGRQHRREPLQRRPARRQREDSRQNQQD